MGWENRPNLCLKRAVRISFEIGAYLSLSTNESAMKVSRILSLAAGSILSVGSFN
jgi:hypothetical protein